MKKRMMIIGMSVVFLMMAASAFSWQNNCPARKGCGLCQAVLNLEGLSADQKTEITELQQTFFNDTNPLRESLVAKRTELNSILGQPEVDKDQAADIQKDIFEISQQIQEKSLAYKISILEKLTPEQKANVNFSGCGRMGCPKMATCPKAAGRGCGNGCGMGMGNGKGRCRAQTRCPAL